MSQPSAENLTASLDPALGHIVDALTARLQAGEKLDAAVILGDHPEFADELRDLWPAIAALGDLSKSPTGSFPLTDGDGNPLDGPLGDFRLIREVGRGGMGIVYEAEQISLCRRVALKVLPFAATMDPRHLQRFRNEAQAAACLHHPNIVPVHGVGCERGVHYYAMQLIEGQTLAQCKEANHDGTTDTTNKPDQTKGVSSLCSLSRRGKERFRQIAEVIASAADALEYAHSMGVVHRDIKPGNLMLDNNAHLWVTDFGLAKLASPGREPGGELTLTGDLLGTLRYMSPEAALARHGLVDHRTDVYSLGATLYELLTLRPAVTATEKHDIFRQIAFEDPTPLRKLDKSIPAELETITFKCLAKDPGERYSSAKEMAEDLRRWLGDQSIKAKPPGWREKAAKWGRRHSAFVGSAFAVLVVAIAGLAAASWLLYQKELETRKSRDLADERFQLARDVINETYSVDTEAAMESERELDTSQRRYLEKAVKFYERYTAETGATLELQVDRGWAFNRIAHIYANIGEFGKSHEACSKAFEILKPLADQYPSDFEVCNAIAETHAYLVNFCDGERAAYHAQQSLSLREQLVASRPDDRFLKHLLANSLRVVAIKGKSDARALLQRAVAIREELLNENPSAGRRSSLAGAIDTLTSTYMSPAGYPDAKPLLLRAVELSKAAVAEEPRKVRYREYLANHYTKLCIVLARLNDPAGAEAAIRAGLAHRQYLVSEFPHNIRWWAHLANDQQKLVVLNFQAGRIEETELAAKEEVRIHREILKRPGHDPVKDRHSLAQALSRLHLALDKGEHYDEAERVGREAILLYQQLASESPGKSWDVHFDLGGQFHNLAKTRYKLGDTADAIRLLETAIETQQMAVDAQPTNKSHRDYLRNHHSLLARYLADAPNVAQRDLNRARRCALRALELDSKSAYAHSTLGLLGLRSGDALGAITATKEALKLDAKDPAGEWFVLAMAYRQIGDVFRAALYFVAASAWTENHKPIDESLERRRAEAAEKLGIDRPPLQIAAPPDI